MPASAKLGVAIATGLLAVIAVLSGFAGADPVILVRGTGSSAEAGQEVTFRLELVNTTDQILYGGVLTATLPAGFNYVPGSSVVLGEGWPIDNKEPISQGQTLRWGAYNLPAAGVTAHNPFGIHTMLDSCSTAPALHLEGAKTLAGSDAYVTQLFYPITVTTTGASECAVNFVREAYARNLIPILRLQGTRKDGIWQAPDPGPNGDYAETAQAYARFVADLPRRNTNPLYIAVWNEPDLWIEWSNTPNATQYAKFFVAVSNAIRQLGDGRIRLVNGALTPGNNAFLDKMLRVPGFKDAFDVWASHCYPYNHPAWYNNHAGTAGYGTYAIDCYMAELNLIKQYGRHNVKVMLTETGYRLGDKTYAFEGFPRITENNRADYIASAFRDYWQKWPEIVAVTPFELSDPAKFWIVYDWISPTYPFTPHLQYDRVSALPKPVGQVEPYGFQVIFKASVAIDVAPGTYALALSGSEAGGSTVSAGQAATVTIYAPNTFNTTIYLPLIFKPRDNSGPWTMEAQAELPTADGAIVPTRLLQPGSQPLETEAAIEVSHLLLDGDPVGLAIDGLAGVVLLADGRLHVINLNTFAISDTRFVGQNPQTIEAGTAGSGVIFVGLGDAVTRLNLFTAATPNTVPVGGRVVDLAWDSAGRRLFGVDAEQRRLVLMHDNPLRVSAFAPLSDQPGQIVFDAATNRLVVSFPGAGQVAVFDAATLNRLETASLTGGPILEMAADSRSGHLYVLNALSPGWRGLTIFDQALRRQALVAGTDRVPLRSASALAVTSPANLLFPEASGLFKIDAQTLTVQKILPVRAVVPAGGLQVAPTGRDIFLLDVQQNQLIRIRQ